MDSYDECYPATRHDAVRICAHLNPKTGKICGARYQQWAKTQDKEPWSYCAKCGRLYNPYGKQK